ncbi:hypothetical protein Sjap_016533 [Stephania japonica]|uniref:Uncharacterized protein n=1 Tax=Stephania japonica TaxID=461633 RepID=A0AAP0IMT4_9MAGN
MKREEQLEWEEMERKETRGRDRAGNCEGDEEINELGVILASFRAQGDGSEPREQGNQETRLRKRDQGKLERGLAGRIGLGFGTVVELLPITTLPVTWELS